MNKLCLTVIWSEKNDQDLYFLQQAYTWMQWLITWQEKEGTALAMRDHITMLMNSIFLASRSRRNILHLVNSVHQMTVRIVICFILKIEF